MTIQRIMWALVAAIALGCEAQDRGTQIGTDSPGDTTQPDDAVNEIPATSRDARPWNASVATATVAGVVKFSGPIPRRRPVDMSGKLECARLHSEPILDESVIVNSNQTLKNTFVWIRRGLEQWQFEAPSKPILLVQRGCRFEPHITGAQIGQPIEISNGDSCPHNVHAIPRRNPGFNVTQAAQGAQDTFRFERADVLVTIKCDIHGWMSTYVGVVPHPFFAISDDSGAFRLPALPAGQYTVEATHEVLGSQRRKLTITENQTVSVEFTFRDVP
ncbi:MAG: carboxypeptidase regulatory-like domain-containing protein [Planctomycetaceae bacterium]